ncbi:hypothetical protein FOZ60_004196 [Perkinsus olseni]|uniref:PAP-associated domain-containing protein n=1 Tax=Perkinsus olseni TaxID=32597 RepID=A0A7J6NTV1_PEROL|nr:hypothetical protein FOZ60_004196 [Perkinsus olseni]
MLNPGSPSSSVGPDTAVGRRHQQQQQHEQQQHRELCGAWENPTLGGEAVHHQCSAAANGVGGNNCTIEHHEFDTINEATVFERTEAGQLLPNHRPHDNLVSGSGEPNATLGRESVITAPTTRVTNTPTQPRNRIPASLAWSLQQAEAQLYYQHHLMGARSAGTVGPHPCVPWGPASSSMLWMNGSAPPNCIPLAVTIDMALFMHLVDTYSTSGDNLKRMRLCSLMQFMIEEFVPPLPTSHENRGNEDEDESGGFTYNLHLPWASDLDFVLLPASRRYERLLAPAKVAAGHHHHHPQQSDTSANPYQSESSGMSGRDDTEDTPNEDPDDDPVKSAAECVKLLELVSDYLTQRLPSGNVVQTRGTITTAPVVITSSRIPLITVGCREPTYDEFERQWCGTCGMGLDSQCSLHAPVQVQISLSGPLHTGLETSAYIAMMNQHFDCLRPLVLFVKHVLLCEDLISPYNGGISSYTLVLMVVSFLNQFYSADSWTEVPLGQLLLGFLLCSSDDEFNFTLRSADEELMETFKMDMLVILDPLSPHGENVNLGKSAWRWPSVTAALRSAKNSLLNGNWWGQKYGISVPTVWIAAKRAGHSDLSNGGPNTVGGGSNASATGTTRSSVEGGGMCRDVSVDDDEDEDDDEGATTIRSATSRATETCCN